jgi:hypothetical protein
VAPPGRSVTYYVPGTPIMSPELHEQRAGRSTTLPATEAMRSNRN